MTKLRSINDAYMGLKYDDPETAMTLSGLRRLVNMGRVPSLRIGRRILIDYDNLIDYLKHPPHENISESEHGIIRKVALS